MKLLFISNLFPDVEEPYRGLDNATLLHQLSDRWDIRVLVPRPSQPWRRGSWQPRGQDAEFDVRYVASPYIPKFGSAWNHRLMAGALRQSLRELRKEFAFDAVLGSWLFPDCCAIAELSREMEFPFVAIAQGSDAHQYLRVPTRRRILLRELPRADAIVTRSAELSRLLVTAGLPSNKLHPIYNGIDHSCFQLGDQSMARQACGLEPAGKVLLFVGNFYSIKNPLLLVEAHARLCAAPEWRETRLIMVGAGPLREKCAQLAQQLGFQSQVTFTGRLDAPTIADHMRAADALCLPSHNEGVPNVILEAFACGLPVVASRVGGIPEVHDAEFLGRLVTPGDATALKEGFEAVLRAPVSRERIHAHAQRFTWESAASAYHELLTRSVR